MSTHEQIAQIRKLADAVREADASGDWSENGNEAAMALVDEPPTKSTTRAAC